MKVFIIGLPKSGRTTLAHSLAKHAKTQYIDASSWIRSTFRERRADEHIQQFEDEYHRYLSMRMMVNPWFLVDHVYDMIKVAQEQGAKNFIIDGVFSPKDFIHLFDYREDVVVFLNRTGNETETKDHETIGISVIRDYCFWLSSAELFPKARWLEYNFKIPGEDNDFVKELGSKNSVFIVRNLQKVISHATERVIPFLDKVPSL